MTIAFRTVLATARSLRTGRRAPTALPFMLARAGLCLITAALLLLPVILIPRAERKAVVYASAVTHCETVFVPAIGETREVCE